MDGLFSIENLLTLFMLLALQAVLGFDNLLYIAIESKRAPAEHQRKVRQWGIGIAVALRIVLLFVIIQAIALFQDELFRFNLFGLVEGQFNGHSLIVLFGGIFIIYTALKEIAHMLTIHELGDTEATEGGGKSVFAVVTAIVLMNVVFSFDSILSALALTDVFLVMAAAIVLSGLLMIVLADHVADFLKKNRLYEVLGLFILLVVGILLLSEGGHLAHLKLAGYSVEPMAKSTFYFVIVVMVCVELVQTQYQKHLMRMQVKEINDPAIKADT